MTIQENKPYILRIGPSETRVGERYAAVVGDEICGMSRNEVLKKYIINADMGTVSDEDLPKIRAVQTKIEVGKNLVYSTIDGKKIEDAKIADFINYVEAVDANVLDVVLEETNKGGLESLI